MSTEHEREREREREQTTKKKKAKVGEPRVLSDAEFRELIRSIPTTASLPVASWD